VLSDGYATTVSRHVVNDLLLSQRIHSTQLHGNIHYVRLPTY